MKCPIICFFFSIIYLCASLSLATGPFTENGDTVYDEATGLTWQKGTADINGDGLITMDTFPGGDRVTWQEALAWCEGSSLASQYDWRLPNIKELKSLVDRSKRNPAIDPVFEVAMYLYWSSTTLSSDPINSWSIDFRSGLNNWIRKTPWPNANTSYQNFVRCVRGGLSGPNYNLAVSINRAGSGTVTSSPIGIDCADDCIQSYASDTVVTLIATPKPGFKFSGWSEPLCSPTDKCVITMNKAKLIVATFDFEQFPWHIFLPAILATKP
jgi:hypothetical protein